MNAVVRPLLLPGQHALAFIAARALQALQDWASDWSRAPLAASSLRVEPLATGALPAGSFVELSAGAGRVWVRSRAEDKDTLAAAVLGDDFLPLSAADAWSLAALRDAMHARNVGLAQALVGAPLASSERHPDAAVFAVGSGAVQIVCEALGLYAIADGSVLSQVPPPDRPPVPARAPLQPVLDAVRSAPVSLTVGLGSVELSLSHLLALETGDVICLPTRLDELLPVALEGRPVAGASLGHCGRHKAVQLVSLSTPLAHGATR